MFQPTMVQADVAQGGGQLIPPSTISAPVTSTTFACRQDSFPRAAIDLDDVDWATPGTELTLRMYQTIGGQRTLLSEGIVTTGPTMVKGVQQPGKKPRLTCRMHADCDIDIEISASAPLVMSGTVES